MAKLSEWLMLFLVNAAWQVAFVSLLAFAADRMLHRASARFRHLLWVGAWLVAVTLAFLTPIRISSPSRATLPIATVNLTPATAPLDVPSTSAQMVASQPASLLSRISIPSLAIGARSAAVIAAFYALLMLFRLGTLALAWYRTSRMMQKAFVVALPPAVETAFARCRRALRTGNVRILSSSVPVPFTLGAIRPAIVLPDGVLRAADANVVTCAIGHELAHIARRDYLFNVIYELVSLPLWFHPALSLMLRRIRETREVRCDEIVTEHLQDARVYAQSLLELAGAALPFGNAAATITVGIADADILEERVKNLLNRPRFKSQNILLTAAALVLAVPSIAMARMALRVDVQPATAVAVQAAQSQEGQRPAFAQSREAAQSFVSQHQVGDLVSGKVVKMTNSRAVIELAPGVYSLMRIPIYDSNPIEIGAVRNFKVVRLVAEEGVINLVDPAASSNGPVGGVVGGVEGGVLAGVKGGVSDGIPGYAVVNTAQGQTVIAAAPKTAFTYSTEGEQGGQSMGPQTRQKLEGEAALKAKISMEGERSLTPEQREKLLLELKQRAEADRKILFQTAREATISMEQAIVIAKGQQAGTVFESRLTRERGVATYIVGIISGDENNSTRTRFLINASDGKVMDTFRSSSNE